MVSIDGLLLYREATFVLHKLSTLLTEKRSRPYSIVCGYIKAQMSIAMVHKTHTYGCEAPKSTPSASSQQPDQHYLPPSTGRTELVSASFNTRQIASLDTFIHPKNECTLKRFPPTLQNRPFTHYIVTHHVF
jgi:hypothetical protein